MAVTGAQFDALVKLMRGAAESPGNRAAVAFWLMVPRRPRLCARLGPAAVPYT